MELIARWSWIALVLGWVAVTAGVASWYVFGSFEGWPTGLLAAGGVLLVVWAVLDRERLGDTVATRQFGYDVGSGVLVLLAVALAVGTYTLARRNDTTWDLTRQGTFTLSDQARSVAQALESDVKVTAFYGRDSPAQSSFRDLIRQFQEVSPHLSVEWIDPLAEPLRAEQAAITGDHGTAILKSGDKEQRLEGDISEDDVVRALVLLESDEEHVVCWSMGHGEPDPDDEFSAAGLGAIRARLEATNFTVRKVRVAQEGVPRDCEVLFVARPEIDWYPYEREALAASLVEGRAAVILLDPGMVPALAADLERFAVVVGNDVVVDLNPKNQLMGVDDPTVAVLSEENFGPHPITRNLGAAIVMPIVRSVRIDTTRQGFEGEELLRTSPEAWGETEPQGLDPRPDPPLEVVGEVPVMVAIRIVDPSVVRVARPGAPAPAPEPAETPADAPALDLEGDPGRAVPADLAPAAGGRLVVAGDSDFAVNTAMLLGNNADLLLNTFAWVADEEEQIGERPSSGETLTMSQVAESLLCLVSVVLVPGAAAAAALAVLLRRRWL